MSATQDTDRIKEAVNASLVAGYLPCAAALKLAGRLGVATGVVGDVVDGMGVRIKDCQLGCFGVAKATHDDLEGRTFSPEVTGAVRGALVDGRLPCKAAQDLGRELKVGFREIGDAATDMGVKISLCQLNCFP